MRLRLAALAFAAAALLFARHCANVVLADLNVKGGEAAAAEASEGGGRCDFQRTDVSEEGDVKALIERAVSEFGKLGVTAIANTPEEADALYDHTLDVLDTETAYGRK